MVQKERRNFEGGAFELADETKTGGAKIVFEEKGRRLTKEANRRCRSGAISGDEESERSEWMQPAEAASELSEGLGGDEMLNGKPRKDRRNAGKKRN